MTVHRLAALAAVAALVLVDTGSAAASGSAPAADPAYPTGSYTLWRTSGYMTVEDIGYVAFTTSVRELAIGDDTTPAATIQRTVYLGDGSTVRFDQEALEQEGGAIPLEYSSPGTFHPSVHLTDGDGRTTVVPLPTVTVLRDDVAPTIRVTVPRLRNRASAWQVVRGVARDTGGTGLFGIDVHVLQQRRGRWYTYDFDRRRWIRGDVSFAVTYRRWWGERAFPDVDSAGRWRTARIRGLTRGRLVVVADTYDLSYNAARTAQVSARLVRR